MLIADKTRLVCPREEALDMKRRHNSAQQREMRGACFHFAAAALSRARDSKTLICKSKYYTFIIHSLLFCATNISHISNVAICFTRTTKFSRELMATTSY